MRPGTPAPPIHGPLRPQRPQDLPPAPLNCLPSPVSGHLSLLNRTPRATGVTHSRPAALALRFPPAPRTVQPLPPAGPGGAFRALEQDAVQNSPLVVPPGDWGDPRETPNCCGPRREGSTTSRVGEGEGAGPRPHPQEPPPPTHNSASCCASATRGAKDRLLTRRVWGGGDSQSQDRASPKTRGPSPEDHSNKGETEARPRRTSVGET